MFVIWNKLVTILTNRKILATIQSPDSWEVCKLALTHDENIKKFSDSSCHLELEEEHQGANRNTIFVAYLGNRSSCGESVEDRGNERNGNVL